MQTLPRFDGSALIRELDATRAAHELSWNELADHLWDQSAVLNEQLGGHRLCPGALVRTAHRATMSCQYALILLRWIRRAPEDFLVGDAVEVGDTRLPEPGPQLRLRWDLGRLHADLNERRTERGLTWAALGDELGCTPSRLTNLKTARLADMELVMRITQWLAQPAARYVDPVDW